MNKHTPRNRSGSTRPMHLKKQVRRARSAMAKVSKRVNRA